MAYEENSQALTKSARAELLKTASQSWQAAEAAAKQAGQLEIEAINHLRLAGLSLLEAAGRDKALSFEFFRYVQKDLPASMDFRGAKFCASIANHLDGPIKSLDEARSARRVLFEAFGQESAPRRLEQQTAHESNPWSEFVDRIAAGIAAFSKIEVEAMDVWDRERLSKFVSTTKPIAERYLEAVNLLGKK